MVARWHRCYAAWQMSAQQSWWIDQPFLLASSNPNHDELARLRLQGFRVLVSLLEESKEPLAYGKKSAAVAGWSTYSMPIAEGGVPTLDQLGSLMARLKVYSKGTKIVIHCDTGMGRTALIGAAYGISKGLTMSQAMARLALCGVPPTWATEKRKELLRQWRSFNGLLAPKPPRAPPKLRVVRGGL